MGVGDEGRGTPLHRQPVTSVSGRASGPADFRKGRPTRLDLSPDVFAVVMATGIVSVAAYGHGYWRLGVALSVLAGVAFAASGLAVLIWALTGRARVGSLTRDPDVALRVFAFVAACAVLGVRWSERGAVVSLLGGFALVAWLLLVPLAVVCLSSRPLAELREHAHGAWLLPSVATAGLATTASALALHLRAAELVVIGAIAWVVAVMIYLAVAWLIAWKALAAPFGPEEMMPDSWILMGALAITSLAGDHLLAAGRILDAPGWLMNWTSPVTLAAWVLASLWIPVLLYAEVWRVDRLPGSLRYQSGWWAAVFPLGMYSAASAATGTELHMHSLETISLVFFWIAFVVWAFVAAGAVRFLLGHCHQ